MWKVIGGLFGMFLAAGASAADLSVDIYRIQAEVAATPEERSKGLMFKTRMPDNQGMVFVFPKPQQVCMWMENTLIPLSVAFLDEKGAIINIEEMKPQTRDSHCSMRPATFALEMNAGWFSRRGIPAGKLIQGVETLPAARR